MTLTKKLVLTLFVLIITFGIYLYFTNKELIAKKIDRIIREYTQNEVIIPKDNKYHKRYDFISVKETNNFKPKNIDELKSIYYTFLNRGWNNFTFYCDLDYTDCIKDASGIAKDDNYLSFLNSYVHPYNSYKKYKTTLIGDNQINLSIDKLYTEHEIEQIESIVNQFLIDNINENDDKKNSIKKIHDYLIQNTTYDQNYKKYSEITISNKANGALMNKIALCSGYADAYAIFLDKLDIPNFKVTSENHEWNAVYIDNKWLHIDVTWEDDEINKNNNYNFYLLNTNELLKKDMTEHDYNQSYYLEFK